MGPSLWIPADASFQQRSSNSAQLNLLKAFSVPLLTCTFLEMSSEPFFIYSKNKKNPNLLYSPNPWFYFPSKELQELLYNLTYHEGKEKKKISQLFR